VADAEAVAEADERYIQMESNILKQMRCKGRGRGTGRGRGRGPPCRFQFGVSLGTHATGDQHNIRWDD